ncbi:enoyl-CoA hydratase/isomerase family protein [Nitratireductor sp. CAU 1489]|uniref:3-hydroxyisobutyryl-CoA hydrolase n=1 Tax=Nitratireductor arenosus TaxID=2682096 RepID=A0A844QIC2_9HYPH|nr:enoyl-CoA hydratase/isomerase family protein [Nitratireductor arenosus]MVA99252.1 enoyl-CoA hydratase/isomerase family protein [Nitratireductor arenosus]
MDFGGGEEIRFERLGAAGVVTLTRPKALNAVTHAMVLALTRALSAWADDPEVALVVIKAEGRAFSAGGDILHIYEAGRAGNPPVDFFADEYSLNLAIARFPKPYIALVDGIAMGGGVGVSFHGSHRLMSENAVFAMPEVGIGFFPDVGGSYILPRLKDRFGLYLGLTGARIRQGDAVWSGLASHAVQQADLEAILTALAESGDADAVAARYAQTVPCETASDTLEAIARHFAPDDLDETRSSLRRGAAAGEDFAAATLDTIARRSPTSLRVTHRQIIEGAAIDMAACMRMEFRVVNRMLAGHDFYEGIRAAIIDKDATPVWRPATLEAVTQDVVDAYFAPLERELDL